MPDRTDLKVGIFVVLALAIFAFATLWIVGRRPLAGDRVSYEVLMQTAGGVRRGDGVRLSGVRVGRVRKVELHPGADWPVVFHVRLDEKIRLSADSSARIASDGLLGANYLEIVTGAAGDEPLPPGSRIEGEAPADPLARVEEIAGRVAPLIDQTAELLAAISGRIDPILAGVETLLAEENMATLGSTLAELRALVADTRSRLPPLLERLEGVAGQAESGLEGVPEVSERMSALLADLSVAIGPEGERLGDALDSAASALDSADGAFGVVEGGGAEIEALIRDLRAAAASLRSLVAMLNERPAMLLRRPRLPERQPVEEPRP